MAIMDSTEWQELGLLQELNREFLHPLGLALAVDVQDGTLAIYDARPDPEGIIFEDDVMTFEKHQRFNAFRNERHEKRQYLLGFIQQPPAEEKACYYCAEPLEDGLCSAACKESAADEGRETTEDDED